LNKESGKEPLDKDQLKKYADDLARLYQSEKQKSKDLEEANKQKLQYAKDLNRAFLDLKTSHRKLQESYLDTIHRLAIASEFKDEGTGSHIQRMSKYCALLAEKLGLDSRTAENIRLTAPMHDIGKIGIPDAILLKKGRLSNAEFEVIKTHTIIGAKILADSKSEILQMAQQISISHHEKWNGKGYPFQLAGEEIPLVGRIVALADVFDALISERPYKKAYSLEVAQDIIWKERGQHFDPRIVDVFFDNLDKFRK
jgi:putative two-component system response regulator